MDPMDYLMPLLVAAGAGFVFARGLVLGRINPGGIEFHRAEEPMAFWGVVLLSGSAALISMIIAISRIT